MPYAFNGAATFTVAELTLNGARTLVRPTATVSGEIAFDESDNPTLPLAHLPRRFPRLHQIRSLLQKYIKHMIRKIRPRIRKQIKRCIHSR